MKWRGAAFPCLLASALLAGCGFHMAGNRPLPEPLRLVRIDMVAPYRVSEPPVETALRNRLQRRGAEVVEKSRDDVTVIRLTDLKSTREVLSVGPDGKAQEYDLILRLNYDVRTGSHVWVPPEPVEVRRDFSFNAEQVLPKEQEAERLREYLEDEMAEVLMLRIEAAVAQAVQQAPVQDAAPGGAKPLQAKPLEPKPVDAQPVSPQPVNPQPPASPEPNP